MSTRIPIIAFAAG